MDTAYDLQSILVQQRTRALEPLVPSDADRAWRPGALPPLVEALCAHRAHACGARAPGKV